MPEMILRMLNKQLQLIEIEIADYRIAKNQGYVPTYPEVYYANLAHAYQGLKKAHDALKLTRKIVHVH